MRNRLLSILSGLLIAASMLAMAACGKEPTPNSDVSGGTGESTASTSADTGPSADSTETAGSGTTETGKGTGSSGGKTTAKPNTKTTKKRLPNVVPTVSQPIITDPLKVNLKGATIKVYTSYPKDQIGVFNTQKGKSQTGNAYADRLTKIQDTIKCKVQVTVVPADQMVSAAFAAVASGESYGHIMEAPIYNAVSYISSGLATNLKTVPTMDLTQSYLNGGQAVKASTLGKGVWFVGTKDMYPAVLGYFFNKRILNEIGYKDTDLYTMVKQNKWTISQLKTIAKKASKDLDGKPGMTSADRFGIIQSDGPSSAVLNYMSANGADMLKADGKGGIKYNMQDANVVKYINEAVDFYAKSGISRASEQDANAMKEFMEGKSLFLGAATLYAQNIVDMEDEYGYLPFPKGDKASGYVASCNWNSTVLMVSGGLKGQELANAGSFLQAFCYLADDCIKAQQAEYRDRYFCDDESYDMFAKSLDSAKIEPVSIFGGGADWNIHAGTFKAIYETYNGKTTPEAYIQANKGVAEAALNDVMKVVNQFK